MRIHNMPSKRYPYNASRPGAMSNTHVLELPLSRTYSHGSTDVRAIEVLLYKEWHTVKGSRGH